MDKTRVEIKLNVSTKQINGLVLYQENNDQSLAMEIRNGKVFVKVVFGTFDILTIESNEAVNDGQKHGIKYTLARGAATLQIDYGSSKTAEVDSSIVLDLSRNGLYVGGTPDDVGFQGPKFFGCVSDLSIHHKGIDTPLRFGNDIAFNDPVYVKERVNMKCVNTCRV